MRETDADPRIQNGWIPATTGCHWRRGPFFVSTVATGDGSRRGYVVYRERERIAEFVDWAEVERITQIDGSSRHVR
jgi:hypothetical protein